jgi:hypothetical protein
MAAGRLHHSFVRRPHQPGKRGAWPHRAALPRRKRTGAWDDHRRADRIRCTDGKDSCGTGSRCCGHGRIRAWLGARRSSDPCRVRERRTFGRGPPGLDDEAERWKILINQIISRCGQLHAHLKDVGAGLDLSGQLSDCAGLHPDPPPKQDAVKAAIQAKGEPVEKLHTGTPGAMALS